MIPAFPTFKPLELSDRADVEMFTRAFPPYSDFNFFSLICWDTLGEHAISQHNGNLVAQFTDYMSGRPFYSFLGRSRISETIQDLLSVAHREGIEPSLKLIPDIVISEGGVDLQNRFRIEEDHDNHDYLLDLPDFLALQGKIYKKKRYAITKYRKQYPAAIIECLNIGDSRTSRELLDVCERWEDTHASAAEQGDNERIAFRRALELAPEFPLHIVGLRLEGRLVGFNFNETLHDGHVMSHYGKMEVKEVGMSDFVEYESARVMDGLGCTRVNLQQDLGLPSLRQYKKSLRPSCYLRKFIIHPD